MNRLPGSLFQHLRCEICRDSNKCAPGLCACCYDSNLFELADFGLQSKVLTIFELIDGVGRS